MSERSARPCGSVVPAQMLVSDEAAIASARSVVARSRPHLDRLLDQAAEARLVHRRDRRAGDRDLVRVGIDGDDLMALRGEAARRDRTHIVETENAELHVPLPLHLPRPRRQATVAPDRPARPATALIAGTDTPRFPLIARNPSRKRRRLKTSKMMQCSRYGKCPQNITFMRTGPIRVSRLRMVPGACGLRRAGCPPPRPCAGSGHRSRRSSASRTPTMSPSSATAPTMASSSIGRPRSKSCSMEVLCSPTEAAPSIRLSTSIGMVTPSLAATASASFMIDWATARVPGSSQMRLQGGAGQRADRIEGDVAPQLDPDLGADVGLHRRLEAGGDQGAAQRRDARRLGAVRLAQRQAVILDMADLARRDDLRRRIDHAADRALPARSGPIACRPGSTLARRRSRSGAVDAMEIPPGHAIDRHHHGGLRPQQRRHAVGDGRDGMRLQRDDHVSPAAPPRRDRR